MDESQVSEKAFADRIRPYFTGLGRRRALKSGFSAEAIRLWLQGRFLPNNKSIQKIAKFCNKDVNWLLTGEDKAAPTPPAPTPVAEPATAENWQIQALITGLQKQIDMLSTAVELAATHSSDMRKALEQNRSQLDWIMHILVETGETGKIQHLNWLLTGEDKAAPTPPPTPTAEPATAENWQIQALITG